MRYEESEHQELNCAAFKSRLDAVLDSRRSPQLDLPLRAHARRCRTCAQWMATQTELMDAVQVGSVPELRPDFALQVVQTAETQRRQQKRGLRRAVASLAVAAGLLIGVTVMKSPTLQDANHDSEVATTSPAIPPEVLKQVGQVSQDIKPMSGSVYTALNAIWLAQRFL
jgi:anti-sigma factor RsiW